MDKILSDIYNADSFRKRGHEIVDLLASVMEQSMEKKIPVNRYIDPETRLEEWQSILEKKDVDGYLQKLATDSIHLYHPHYLGHQISPPAPIAALSGLVADFLNNGMGVYEMGGPSTALEKIVIKTISDKVGFSDVSDGFLTSGGTLANLTAMLTARAKISGAKIWSEGYQDKKYAIMVSEQAHYCVDRAARIMGLGEKGILKIPADKSFRIRTDLLEDLYRKAQFDGIEVFAIIGSACTTSTGSYDDLEKLGAFAGRKNIWFHVDGAHGGAAIFSKKYRHLLNGVSAADSVVIDCHKMMMTPALATALIYNKGENAYATFAQHAQYLFDKEEQEWHNLAKRTFECTKFMMSVKFASILIEHGEEGIGHFVETLYDLARAFAIIIQKRHVFELAHEPDANILCFRINIENQSDPELNNLNRKIREKVLSDGHYYIVQTNLHGKLYLRTTLMNPFTTIEDLSGLLDYLEDLAYFYNQ